ncbi:MAG TPA: radical SAM protein [bacterium]|nr:radical SAM protein [bacterium]
MPNRQLEARAKAAFARLEACDLCPRNCGVARTRGETGVCKGGILARVSSMGPHFGEESPLVGEHGSGTIFFTGCSLGCAFCQNYDISHQLDGREVPPRELADMMLRLEDMGCHNINLVTPTHFVAQIIQAVALAAADGLGLPLVYNCGGYETLETLKLLDGIVDIYMPDFKFWEGSSAERYAGAPDYPGIARDALREMQRQVGDLVITDGLAVRGLLVRHLVMPGGCEESKQILSFIAREISPRAFVNVMDQYRPCYRAEEFAEIARRPTAAEFRAAVAAAKAAGLQRIYT